MLTQPQPGGCGWTAPRGGERGLTVAGSNALRVALGAGVAVVILGVAVVVEPLLRPQAPAQQADIGPDSSTDPSTDSSTDPAANSGPASVAVPSDAPATALADVALPDPASATVVPAETVAPAPAEVISPPLIDVVRIDPDGAGIVAGQAPAGMEVAVMLGDAVLAQAVADASGSFVAFVALPPSDQPRTLSLIADPAGAAVMSDATVIVAPSVAVPPVIVATVEADSLPGPDPIEIVPDPDLLADLPAPEDAEPQVDTPPETAVAPEPEPEQEPEPEPLTTPVAAADTSQTVVADQPAAPAVQPGVPGADPTAAADPTDPAETLASAQTMSDTLPVGQAPVVDPAPALLDTAPVLQPLAPDAPGIAPVLRVDQAGVRVLQPAIAPGATPEVLATVALDSIAYDAGGDVQLSGRAVGGGTVRVYVDNTPVIDVSVGPDGQWASGLPDVAPGVYTMRVDQLDASGAVVSRIETPFLREERATIAAVMVDETTAPDFTVAVKTVQPGATLWAIARERYGDGVMYVQVFEANRDRIRNPDLIYPGQVFVLPDLVAQ